MVGSLVVALALALAPSALVASWFGAPAAAAQPCTASGVFSTGTFASYLFWDLHDRAGEVSGSLRYYAWNVLVDIEPSVRQVAAVSGHRRGNDVVLAVADPLGSSTVRKVRATLACGSPTPRDRTNGVLIFPLRWNGTDGRQAFARSSGASPIRMLVDGQTKSLRSMNARSIGTVRFRAAHEASLHARVTAEEAKLRRHAAALLDAMAEASISRASESPQAQPADAAHDE